MSSSSPATLAVRESLPEPTTGISYTLFGWGRNDGLETTVLMSQSIESPGLFLHYQIDRDFYSQCRK